MIGAVIVTHSAPAPAVVACVRSVVAGGGVDRILVVANGSDDDRRAVGEALHAAGLDGVEVVGVENRGYGSAANAGFRRLLDEGATAVALLNDDITVRAGWLEPLAAALDAHRVGAAQPKLLVKGTDPPVVNSLGVLIGPDGAGTDIGDGEVDAAGSGATAIEAFTGGAVLLSADFLRATGGFDERWFLYYEDADLAARGSSLGWGYVVVHDSVVEHARGLTTGAAADRTRYFQERNRIWHACRHCDASTIARALWLSARRLRWRPRGVHARALAAGLLGAPPWLWRRLRHQNTVALRDCRVGRR